VVDIEVTRWEDTGGTENKGDVDIEVPTSKEWEGTGNNSLQSGTTDNDSLQSGTTDGFIPIRTTKSVCVVKPVTRYEPGTGKTISWNFGATNVYEML
jgi:hypothetical protein